MKTSSGALITDKKALHPKPQVPRQRWTAESQWLPARCVALLDAEGVVRGKTWRQMPSGPCGNHAQEDVRAINWWLWKRGLLHSRREWHDANYRLSQAQRGERAGLKAMEAAPACASCDAGAEPVWKRSRVGLGIAGKLGMWCHRKPDGEWWQCPRMKAEEAAREA